VPNIERNQVTLFADGTDSGASLIIRDLPASVGTSIEFRISAFEGKKGAVQQLSHHPQFEELKTKPNNTIVQYIKTIFDAVNWLDAGILNPIDPSRIHSIPPLKPGEKWSGYFVNLLVPDDAHEPSLSIHFLQRHQTNTPALKTETIVSLIADMIRFATDPSAKASSN